MKILNKRNLYLFVIYIIFCLHSMQVFAFESEQFKLLTSDRTSYLHGQITFPSSSDGKTTFPVVFFKNRTEPKAGLSDWESQENQLRSQLLDAGFAVVQYGERGVYCNTLSCVPCYQNNDSSEIIQTLLTKKEVGNLALLVTDDKVTEYRGRQCIVTEERINVSWDNVSRDFIDVVQLISQNPKVDSNQIIAIGVGEGGVHVAKAIESDLIHPQKVIFISTPFSSMRRQAEVSIAFKKLEALKEEMQRCVECEVDEHIIGIDPDKKKINYNNFVSGSVKKILSASTKSQLIDKKIAINKKISAIDTDWNTWYKSYMQSPLEKCNMPEIAVAVGAAGEIWNTHLYSAPRDCDEKSLFMRLEKYKGSISIYRFPQNEVTYFNDDVRIFDGLKLNKNQQILLQILDSVSQEGKRKDYRFAMNDLTEKIMAEIKEDRNQLRKSPFLINENTKFELKLENGHLAQIRCASQNNKELGCSLIDK